MAYSTKTYKCKLCNTEIQCVKYGEGYPECCEQPMEERPTLRAKSVEELFDGYEISHEDK